MKTCILTVSLLIFCIPARPEDPERYYLGRIDPAGLVPEIPPPVGSEPELTSPEQPLTHSGDPSAGFIPAVYREQIASMLRQNVRLFFRVEHHYHNPRPGKFISVEVWAETSDPGLLVPLIYPAQPARDPGRGPEVAILND